MDHPSPDGKDWTWVLGEQCPDCGFKAATIDPSEIGPLMRANAASFRSALKRGDIVSQRPPVASGAPIKWSALEYGAHVRDVYKLAAERITRMIKKTAPTFKDWDQDEAAIKGKYSSADAGTVSFELATNAGKVADLLDKVRGDEWQRTGMRNDGAGFTIATLAAYFLHDVTHHLWDVEQGYETIKEAKKKTSKEADENG